jgi:catechol 2,3-dioxygenase-like lactoylglutathione lyase family enzyme
MAAKDRAAKDRASRDRAAKKNAKVAAKSKQKRKVAAKPAPKSATKAASDGLTFNHAMIYCRDVARSAAFYRDQLGFRVVDEYPGAYTRLCSPSGGNTIALHCLEDGQQLMPSKAAMRLYFEVKALDAFCQRLATNGVAFEQMPKDMPWGWKHAYLKDPDGHEISLYWAGPARLKATRLAGGDH